MEAHTDKAGFWERIGVLIGAAALFITVAALFLTYIGVAAGLKWWPFDHASNGRPPASSSAIASRSTSSPSPTSGSFGATFLSVTDVASSSPDYYVYTLKIEFTGLAGMKCAISWHTVTSSGANAGTSGKLMTVTLPYNDDIWTDTGVDVTAPLGSFHGMNWSTDFAVYAPDGEQIASFG